MKSRILPLAGSTLAALICVSGSALAADPAPVSPKPPVFDASAHGLHRITIKARVDAKCQIVFQDGRMYLNSAGSKPAESITVNSRKWKPVFNKEISEDFKFGEPLLPFSGKPVTAKLDKKARISVTIREQPAQGSEKAVIELEDAAAGPSEFELVITW